MCPGPARTATWRSSSRTVSAWRAHRTNQQCCRADLDTHCQHDCSIECRESKEKPLLALGRGSPVRISVALCEATETERPGRAYWTHAPVCLDRTHCLRRREQWGRRWWWWQHRHYPRSLYDHCHWQIRFAKRDGWRRCFDSTIAWLFMAGWMGSPLDHSPGSVQPT